MSRSLTLKAGLLTTLLAVSPALAAGSEVPVLGPASHAAHLIARAQALHPNLTDIAIYATLPGTAGAVEVASSGGPSGARAGGETPPALADGATRSALHGGSFAATLPLFDMQHRRAGTVTLRLAARPGQGQKALLAEAAAIEGEMARRISYAANLAQAAQIDPHVPTHSYAQYLVDRTLARHPHILILAIHATTPKNADPEILASNIGRIGKPADEDDMRVVRDGKTNLEVNDDLKRFEVELPLTDVSTVRIGALGVVFALPHRLNRAALQQRAVEIRDEIGRRILKPANLVEPYPYDPRFSDDTMAQALVDKVLAAHPDILVLALHVTPPQGGKNVILASNIGRIGKIADDDDMSVVRTGKPDMAVNAEGNRFEAELALKDRAHEQIGAVSVVYSYKPGDDKAAIARKAQTIADALSRQIPNAASLFRKAQ